MMAAFFVFVLGTVVGSFLNVCITRLPQGKSVISPRSQCPQCLAPIRALDNIPVASFLCLRGRCRDCGKKILLRYFVVELAGGILWWSLWIFRGSGGWFWGGGILGSILLAVSVADLESGVIPDALVFPGMVFGAILSAIFPEIHRQVLWHGSLIHSLLGLGLGFGLMVAVTRLGRWLFYKEAMGEGDIKLLAMMGSFLGPIKIFYVFFLAAVLALPFGLYARVRHGSLTIPYGPFLAAAGAWFYVYPL